MMPLFVSGAEPLFPNVFRTLGEGRYTASVQFVLGHPF